jgi:hypothetical protein
MYDYFNIKEKVQEKYKSVTNVQRTSSLFLETAKDPSADEVVFSFYDRTKDKPHLYWFKPIYLFFCVNDPTEYMLATTVFDSWRHWVKISEHSGGLLGKYLQELRDEADVARKAKMFEHIIEEAQEGSKNRFQASKYLLEESYLKSKTKEQKEAHDNNSKKAIDKVSSSAMYKEDYERILKLN